MQPNSDLINFSRAGDIFHYRWAVKRCLKLLDFNTDLTHITIEGSQEKKLAGECVVDLAEYRKSDKGEYSVGYFQLKHSTVQENIPFTLSLLKDTVIGLSQRFSELTRKPRAFKNVTLTIITNRLISSGFKKNIEKIASGLSATKKFTQTLESYTNLKGDKLKKFCKCLKLCDTEGNYDAQKNDVHKELSKLMVSKNVADREKLLVAKVWEKIEPGKSNVLKKEDMLEAFDVTDYNDFFPAPPLFEPIPNYIPRKDQSTIAASIRNTVKHTIITANGGVGKSALCCNLSREFTEQSIVIPYDCFGNGSYRRPSAKRHGAKHALRQIINTLAKEGLCDQIIPSRNEPDEYWINHFLNRVNEVCNILSNIDKRALLVFIFDAADNAEMAAEEFGESCFASQLLKETVPSNCRLVFTCRPERLHLLDPPSKTEKLKLSEFTDEETLENLLLKYPKANSRKATEFNRLTGGNPRVQSNALSLKTKSLDNLLLSFGSTPTSVEKLIERQLEESVNRITDEFPKNYRRNIESICTGLATLPPFVPIEVLSSVANVSKDSVRSFVTDLGRPLWRIDDAVQFRDEPTEKWFQDNYSATPEKISAYVDAIKPLVGKIPYAAEALPILLLKAERFDELVELALSDSYLPSVSSFDDNQLKIHRLQYAFKAALKGNRLFEAVKLALKAGEEIASNERQIDILSNNIDLTTRFLTEGRIQELAHRKELRGAWSGSELVYSASLLASISSLKGEAISYFRSADHWLQRYFEKRDQTSKEEDRYNEKLNDIEVVELASTQYRINGWGQCVDFLLSWSPSEYLFRITSAFFERLVDAGEFENIDLMANYGRSDPSFILAVTHELMRVGKTPPRQCLTRCLNQIIKPNLKLDKPTESYYREGYSLDAYLSFFEACLIHRLPLRNIRRGINYYFSFPTAHQITDEFQHHGGREALLRYLAIQAAINKYYNLRIDDYSSKNWKDKKDSYESSRVIEQAKELVEKLLPWYMVRAKILAGEEIDLLGEHDFARKQSSSNTYRSYREYDPIPNEITKARFQNFLYFGLDCSKEFDAFIRYFESEELKSSFIDNIYYLRTSCRNEKLHELCHIIEDLCAIALSKFDVEVSPESYSESYIKLARAVMNIGPDDASVYFDDALTKASNFGQEAVIRWEALTAIAKRSAANGERNPELAHRYMRCAEMIGDSVDREKYWNRSDSVVTCFQLSPESAFAISNRWKERGVGWHERLVYPLANSAIDSKLASPAALWALSAFSWEYGRVDFSEKCISQESSKQIQQKILDQLIRDFRIKGIVGKKWKEISKIAERNSLENIEIENLKQLLKSCRNVESSSSLDAPERARERNNKKQWEKNYGQFDILTPSGFRDAYTVYDSKQSPGEHNRFWSGCFNKVTSRRLMSFLRILTETDLLDFYDIRSAFEKIPSNWKEKRSVIKGWDNLITYLASRFPNRFTGIYERSYTLRSFIINEDTKQAIQYGVVKGLSDSVNIESASALFSFAHYSASELTVIQSKDLIDFGLSRFEELIVEDYADGNWSDDNQLPNSVEHALVCYIYANLGSPYAEERWRAVHAVFRLYNLGCKKEIGLLIDCMNSGLPNIFIPNKYEFYDLHAKLYLLVALTRCVYETPVLLIEEVDILSGIALNNKQGILFQYYAKQICLEIERREPGTIEKSIVDKIYHTCVTHLPLINENMYRYKTDSPWHKDNSLGELPEVLFAIDFDRNWFAPLGRVFGISGRQVEDLAKDILLNQWGISFDSQSIPDSRVELWNKLRNSYDAYESRSSYSRIDKYNFYISYHLMLEVASKLLESMPVLLDEDEEGTSWDNWLARHLILNNNEFFLSELRDPMPIERRDWVGSEHNEDWRWCVLASDFIDQLIIKKNSTSWLNVEGCWYEYENGRKERISFSSVLVPKKLSQSLLHTMDNFENHLHECYLYNFCDSDFRRNVSHGFRCIQWLTQERENNDIESKDPFVGEMYAVPFELNEDIIEAMNIVCSEDRKKCVLFKEESLCLENRYWSEDKQRDSENFVRTGSLVSASLDLLKLICQKMNVEIAIQVNIERTDSTYRNRNKSDELGYVPGYSKTFILSEDGLLRETRKYYQLR